MAKAKAWAALSAEPRLHQTAIESRTGGPALHSSGSPAEIRSTVRGTSRTTRCCFKILLCTRAGSWRCVLTPLREALHQCRISGGPLLGDWSPIEFAGFDSHDSYGCTPPSIPLPCIKSQSSLFSAICERLVSLSSSFSGVYDLTVLKTKGLKICCKTQCLERA